MRAAATLLSLLSLVLVYANSATARDLPKLQLVHPQPNSQYSLSSSVAVNGQLSRPLPLQIRLEFYHVNEQGERLRVAGIGAIEVKENGAFMATVFPPQSGWPVGKVRLVAFLEQLRQVVAESEIVIVNAAGDQRVAIHERAPKSSGIVVDALEKPNKGRAVPPGELFLVRGEFDARNALALTELGPHVLGAISRAGVIFRNATCVSFWDKDAKKYWFELQLQAPASTGDFVLELKSPYRNAAGDLQYQKWQVPLAIQQPRLVAIY